MRDKLSSYQQHIHSALCVHIDSGYARAAPLLLNLFILTEHCWVQLCRQL